MSDGEEYDHDGAGGGGEDVEMDAEVHFENEDDEAKPAVVEISKPNSSSSRAPQPRDRGDYTTTKFLTKYERARVLGTRALQISMGAPCCVAIEGETDCLRIAQKELQQGKLPIIVRRFLPDNTYEDWKLEDLITG
ncbi:hypothetical protein BASA81_006815 [Batrachochytrium salamandrivorans]|nr:hypothetical protein BASA81_006815 [Batrachochytrium salamandrivorans]